MAAPEKSPFAHGRSEIWMRRSIAREIRREQRKLGGRLRAVRQARAHTLESAAEEAGIHWGHLGAIERGEVNVTFGILVALARAYRVWVDDFFRDDVPPPSRPKPRRFKTAAVRSLRG